MHNEKSAETRLVDAYGGLMPSEKIRDRILTDLPTKRRSTPRGRLRPVLVALAVAACFALVMVIWPGEATKPLEPKVSEFTLISFAVDGEVDEVIRIMNARLDARGIEGVEVRAAGPGADVQALLPKGVNPAPIAALLARPGTLEFRIVAEVEEGEGAPPDATWVPSAGGGRPLLLQPVGDPEFAFSGRDIDISGVAARPSEFGTAWVVSFALVEERHAAFARFTTANKKRRLAIVIDGEVETAPMIQETLPGTGQISGGGMRGFSEEEARAFAAVLKSGALPYEVRPIQPK